MNNWNGNYLSIYNCIDAIYRDSGMTDQVNINDVVEWVGEAMEFIAVPCILSNKISTVKILEKRGALPLGIHLITGVRGVETTVDTETCIEDQKLRFYPMVPSTDIYVDDTCAANKDYCASMTYYHNGDFIFPSFDEGYVQVAYKSIPVDDEGYPLIPDQIKIRQGVQGHVKWKLAFMKWSQGKMRDAVYYKIEADRDWYIGGAQTAAKNPGYDGMENIKNFWLSLIKNINHHKTGFKDFGEPERRYNNNASRVLRGGGGTSLFYGGPNK